MQSCGLTSGLMFGAFTYSRMVLRRGGWIEARFKFLGRRPCNGHLDRAKGRTDGWIVIPTYSFIKTLSCLLLPFFVPYKVMELFCGNVRSHDYWCVIHDVHDGRRWDWESHMWFRIFFEQYGLAQGENVGTSTSKKF